MTTSYVAVDLETTGIGTKTEKITEIGMVKVVDGTVVDTYHTMVNPYRPIPERVVELTGITDDMVKDAPGIEEVLPAVVEFCEGFPLLGHQIIFDFGFLTQATVNAKIKFQKEGIDTLKLCRYLMPGEEKKNLGAACAYFGITPETAHRALSDAMSAHLLYGKLMEKFGESRSDLFEAKPLVFKAKKERPATKRQKQHLQDLLKYHRIVTTIHIDKMSGNEISRMIDKIIFTHGRIPETARSSRDSYAAEPDRSVT
ncbi:MAG: 3'-5' exonuclease [Lachnospiraceae bacterium]|nr:3'-5' exonuclease [Lachnospiraceae bacterium]